MVQSGSKQVAISGRETDASRQLFNMMYDDFHRLASSYVRAEQYPDCMSARTLVHEAFIRMADLSHVGANGRSHFFAIGARIMRQLLVDNARLRNAKKRGRGWRRVQLTEAGLFNISRDDDVLELNELLLELEQLDSQQARVVEMRFFTGMSMVEIAKALKLNLRDVEREWMMARAWFRSRLSESNE